MNRDRPSIWGLSAGMALSIASTALFAQTQAPLLKDPVFARSHSGQFIVQGTVGLNQEPLPPAAVEAGLMRVNASLLPVSCERIKHLVWRDLGVTGPYRGKIYLGLRPLRLPDEPITIVREHYQDGWVYRVDLPDTVQQSRYVRAMVQVTLLELANRNAGARCAEIPAWLTEGMASSLLAAHGIEIVLQPPRAGRGPVRFQPTLFDDHMPNPLEAVHYHFTTNQPLTFDELSWPAAEHLGAAVSDTYRMSAQLFVNGLTELPGGPAALRRMLEALPRYQNWQFAFLETFSDHFQRPLDVEKWWMVYVVRFAGRELRQNWGVDESCQKLRETLVTRVQTPSGTNSPPRQDDLTLQNLIRDWEWDRQKPVLETRISELVQLRLQVAPGLSSLAEAYRAALQDYLQQRERHSAALFRKKNRVAETVDTAVKRLDDLDAQAAALVSLRERARTLTNSASASAPEPWTQP